MRRYSVLYFDWSLVRNPGDDIGFRIIAGEAPSQEELTQLVDQDGYGHVADVVVGDSQDKKLPDLEEIFVTLQNDAPVRGTTVQVETGEDAMRSLSMGDLIVDEQDQVHFCERVGFRNIGTAPAALKQKIEAPGQAPSPR